MDTDTSAAAERGPSACRSKGPGKYHSNISKFRLFIIYILPRFLTAQLWRSPLRQSLERG
jgi:hypothetical protein